MRVPEGMRLAFLSRRFFPAISGMSVYARNLLAQLVAHRHDVTMFSQYRNDPEGVAVYGGGPPPAVPGVAVVGLEALGEQAVGRGELADFERDIEMMVAAMCEAHRRTPFELLHAQYGYPTGLAALEAGRRLELPVVVSIQGGDGHWVGTCCDTHKRAMQAVLTGADAVIIGSASFLDEVVSHQQVARDLFTIVPGGTDTARFSPRPGRTLGAIRSPPRLLYHGRVDARKGVIELLEACEILRAAGRDFALRVSGIGPDVDAAKARAASLGLSSRVRFSGYVGYDEAPQVYADGDLFVSPTYAEGFSNTILEAMACGLPIVSTVTVGVVDCLEHEVDSLLVPVKDVSGLASAIARLLDDQPLRERLAGAALEKVRRLYSWEAVSAQIEQVYRSVAGRTPAREWTSLYDPARVTRESADQQCRFRRAPHLL